MNKAPLSYGLRRFCGGELEDAGDLDVVRTAAMFEGECFRARAARGRACLGGRAMAALPAAAAAAASRMDSDASCIAD